MNPEPAQYCRARIHPDRERLQRNGHAKPLFLRYLERESLKRDKNPKTHHFRLGKRGRFDSVGLTSSPSSRMQRCVFPRPRGSGGTQGDVFDDAVGLLNHLGVLWRGRVGIGDTRFTGRDTFNDLFDVAVDARARINRRCLHERSLCTAARLAVWDCCCWDSFPSSRWPDGVTPGPRWMPAIIGPPRWPSALCCTTEPPQTKLAIATV